MTTIVAVRHGETTWTREERVQGWAPVPLTDRGREQVAALGATLADRYAIDRVLSSDLHRAAATVEILRESLDAPVTTDPAWRERDLGVFQGLRRDELAERFPEFDLEAAGAAAADRRPEGGESLLEVRDRVVGRWETTLEACGPDETVLVVTHGGPIRLLLGHLKGLDVVDSILAQSQGYCSINEVEINPATGEARVVRENETGHC